MRKFLWLLLLCNGLNLHAQNSCMLSIRGVVIDEHDETALAFAEVGLLEQGRWTVSDENGRFLIDELCPGSYRLKVTHLGCEPMVMSIELSRDTTLQLFLEHHQDLLEMVEVEAKKPHQDISGRQSLSLEKLQRNEGQSLAELLDDLQGVQTMRNGGNISKPMIHGMHSNRLVIVNENTRIEGQQWGGEHAPELDPMATEELEVVQGASSLRYGPEAIAGAIIAKNGRLDADTSLNGWAHFGGASNGRRGTAAGKLQGRFYKKLPLYFQLQGSLSRGGDLEAPDYVINNTGSFERHWQGRLAWIKDNYGAKFHYAQFNTDLGIMEAAHIGNLSDLNFAIEQEQPVQSDEAFDYEIMNPRQEVQHELAAGEVWWRPQLESKLRLNVSRQYNLRREYDRSIFGGDAPDLQYEITTWQGDGLFEHRWSARLKSEIGISSQTQANTYTGRFFIPNFRSYQLGGFFIQHVQWDRVEVEAGIRYDQEWLNVFMNRADTIYNPKRRFNGLSWNAGVSWQFGRFELSTNVAQGWRPPAINELYSGGLHHGAGSVEFGNENLSEERVVSWTNQLTSNGLTLFGKNANLSVTAHTSYFDQFIYLVPSGSPTLTIRGAFPTFEYQRVDAWFRGVDFSAQIELTNRLVLNTSGEIVRANAGFDGEALLFIPPDRYDLGMRVFLTRKKTWFLETSGTAVLSQSRFPEGVDYAPPPDGFILVNAGVGGNFDVFNHAIVTSLRVENLLNKSYRSYVNRLRYFADEPGRDIVFSLRYMF